MVAGESLITGRDPGNALALRRRDGKVFLDLPEPSPNMILEMSSDLKTWVPASFSGPGIRREIEAPIQGSLYYRYTAAL